MANLSDFRVDIVPGPGLVARFPTAMLVVPSFKAGQRQTVQELLELCKSTTGSILARRLAEKVISAPEDSLPGFAAVAEVEGRLNAFLYGAADVSGSGPSASIHISGSEAATWVDRALDADLASIAFGASDAMPVAEGGLFDLGLGVVPGKGALLTLSRAPAVQAGRPSGQSRRAAPAAAPKVPPPAAAGQEDAGVEDAVTDFFPAQAPASSQPEPQRPARRAAQRPAAGVQARSSAPIPSSSAATATPAAAPPPRQPEPVPAPTPEPVAAPQPRAKEPAIVKGVICPGPGRHFNHPDALNCWQDGLSMVQITRLLVDGQRPSLGTLVLDDGSAQEVDSDFVVGRQPEEDPLVQAGTAKPFRLADPSRLVSGRHAVLKLVGWEVYVEDLGSRNGTFAVAPDGRETPVGAKPVLIESGASVRVGNRRLTYHSHHRVK